MSISIFPGYLTMNEFEWEFEDELEAECEGECEAEWEDEFESAGSAGGALLGGAAPSPRLAVAAARSILRPAAALVGPTGQALGTGPLAEMEWEFEDEALLNPARRAYPSAAMAHLGHAAANARTPAEAEAFLGALVPLAAQLVPRIAPAVMRAAPALIRGVSGLGRTLLRSPITRPLLRAAPTIVRGTVANLARQVAQGRPLTAQGAVRTLARQTQRTLATPRRAAQAVQQARTLDRQYHRQAGGCRCR